MVRFTLEQIQEADDNQEGFCIECGAAREGCEPDARRYACDDCGKASVYGAQELVLMGLAS